MTNRENAEGEKIMEFKELLKTRESCRNYSDKPVPHDLLEYLVEAAHLSPSGCNAQPWHFIIVDEPKKKSALVEALDDEGLIGCPWGSSVPAFIIICETEAKLMPGVAEKYGSQRFAQMDIGIAAMTLCYAATDSGLGTCILGTFNEKKMKAAFDIPDTCPVRLIITVGYEELSHPPRNKIRNDKKMICGHNHW